MLHLLLISSLACPLPPATPQNLVAAGFNVLDRVYWRTYDTDGDLKEDYHVEYEIQGQREDKTFKMSTFPVRYYIDKDHDGVYESIYIDVMGNGRCEDLKPYTGRETNK